MTNVFGFSILIIYLLRQQLRAHFYASSDDSRLRGVFSHVAEAYHNGAIFLAFSVQIASIIVLARNDFGLSSQGLGAVTLEITWTASLLTLLPLVYCTFVPALCRSADAPTQRPGPHPPPKASKREREKLRTYLFLVCWLMSVYPFLSRMIETFAPSKIGSANGAVVSDADWSVIEAMCLGGVPVVGSAEANAFMAIGITGWLLMALFALYIPFEMGVKKHYPDSALAHLMRSVSTLQPQKSEEKGQKRSRTLFVVLAFVVPVIAAVELVAVFRFRGYQAAIAESGGYTDTDVEWSFGQIVAVVIFAPVLPEAWCAWREQYH